MGFVCGDILAVVCVEVVKYGETEILCSRLLFARKTFCFARLSTSTHTAAKFSLQLTPTPIQLATLEHWSPRSDSFTLDWCNRGIESWLELSTVVLNSKSSVFSRLGSHEFGKKEGGGGVGTSETNPC